MTIEIGVISLYALVEKEVKFHKVLTEIDIMICIITYFLIPWFGLLLNPTPRVTAPRISKGSAARPCRLTGLPLAIATKDAATNNAFNEKMIQ